MIVYRVENKEGCGPYYIDDSWFGRAWICDAHNFKDHTPNVQSDIIGFEDGMLCGFTSLENLEIWFSGWLDLLIFVGFRVVKYDVIGYLGGEKQICFVVI